MFKLDWNIINILLIILVLGNCYEGQQNYYNEGICQEIDFNKVTNQFIETGGWDPAPIYDILLTALDVETVDRVNTGKPFKYENVSYPNPIIWSTPMRQELQDFIPYVNKQRLLCEFSEKKVELSNSITFSYDKLHITFYEYIELMEKEKSQPLEEILEMDAGTTWYNFGGNDWPHVDKYYIPPQGKRDDATPTFGIGRTGSGVPFHFHGPVYLEMIYGQKIWFFAAPDCKPDFNPEESTLNWFYRGGHKQECVKQVVQKQGEIIYIPNLWWHATLNIGETVFVANFA